MSDLLISSEHNPLIKLIRKLQAHRRARSEHRLFVAEGTRWLLEIRDSELMPHRILYTEEWIQAEGNADLLAGLGKAVPVTSQIMKSCSALETAPGLLVLLPFPDLKPVESPRQLLILDAIANPGNLGTLLRTALAAGVDQVILTPGTVDPFNPKVVSAAKGALLRQPIASMNWEEIEVAVRDIDILVSEAGSGTPYYEVDWCRPNGLIVGSEAHGASSEALSRFSAQVTIPMPGKIESLNAAAASAVILFEAARQRAFAATPAG